MLDSDYKPRKSILDVNPSLTLHPGDFYTFVPEQKR
jgi:hypothetical protein